MPIFVGIGGGSASGKTSLCEKIKKHLESIGVTCEILSADNWYNENNQNFDCPEAYNFDEIYECLQKLKHNSICFRPVYNYKTHSRTSKQIQIPQAMCYLLEGILVLNGDTPHILNLLDIKLFIDADSDVRLCRRIRRDLQERDRDINSILDQHEKMVKPGYDNYINVTRHHADMIVPYNTPSDLDFRYIIKLIKNAI